MKNFNIMGVHWKIRVLSGVHEKAIYVGDWHKKGGLESFAELRKAGNAWQENREWCFWGAGDGDTPMRTMLKEFTVASINYLGWELNLAIKPPRFF